MIEVMAPGMFVGSVIDVVDGITRKGVLSRMVVEAPVNPGIPVATREGQWNFCSRWEDQEWSPIYVCRDSAGNIWC